MIDSARVAAYSTIPSQGATQTTLWCISGLLAGKKHLPDTAHQE